ncbi:MAG: hypothetical protein AAGB31_01575 [Bdellovibrio sp.]
MLNQVARKAVVYGMAVTMLAGCSKGSDSFSLLNNSDDYEQQAVIIPQKVSKKIDILWVIDNSGSMETSQNQLASNFQSFIQKFQSQDHDFHMAVTTTEAWEKQFNSNSSSAKIKDGAILQTTPRIETHSGVYVMDQNTANLDSVFSINVKQGLLGNGDERAFESFKQTLLEGWNSAFRRPEAFLAIIIVSDEEDFSASTAGHNESYSNPNLYSVQSYVDFLDSFTQASIYGKNYSVNSIFVPDAACKTALSTDGFQRKISTRLPELSDLTGGVKGSLCSNFGETLEFISDTLIETIELASTFKLNREPQEDTIVVRVNGVVVAKDSVNGWSYNSSDWTITFHGSSVPADNADIKISYYPKSIKL